MINSKETHWWVYILLNYMIILLTVPDIIDSVSCGVLEGDSLVCSSLCHCVLPILRKPSSLLRIEISHNYVTLRVNMLTQEE